VIRHSPRLRKGLIVAYALADVSRLEVEVLSVQAAWLTDHLLRAAHRLGQEVQVWTVNDARQMAQLIKRGVDNIITSDPNLAIRTRDERADPMGTGRLVLASRLVLGLDPGGTCRGISSEPSACAETTLKQEEIPKCPQRTQGLPPPQWPSSPR
jgi:hypothetical protein